MSMKCRVRELRTSIFLGAKKVKEKLDQKRIYNSRKHRTIQQLLVLELHRPAHQRLSASAHAARIAAFERGHGPGEMDQLYAKLNQCKIKAVALSLIDPFADQFIDQSRSAR